MVKIYTTPTCAYCHAAMEFFKEHSIAFEEFNVFTDLKAREEMIRISGGRSVPVIVAGEEVMIGFDQARIEKILEGQE